MRRRPHELDSQALRSLRHDTSAGKRLGFVLSGGGSRAAYQAGALRALIPHLERSGDRIAIVVGSSIGAINGLIFGACLTGGIEHSVSVIEALWRQRTFKNTFRGRPSQAFVKAIKLAILQYMSPGPKPTSDSVFDPTPLMLEVDEAIQGGGGLRPADRHPDLESIAVMTTIEGKERKPLLFLSSRTEFDDSLLKGASFDVCQVPTLTAKHGFASAALPTILPPVELDTERGKMRLVDGGISQNIPVDPAVRLGAERVVIIDISGRTWWLDRYHESHDTRPDWEVPAELETFCLRPPETFVIRNQAPFGPLLQQAVSRSTRKFIEAVGPTWPFFKLLKSKCGEDVAYEAMTYVALDPDYIAALMELGYAETRALLRNRVDIQFRKNESFDEIAELQTA